MLEKLVILVLVATLGLGVLIGFQYLVRARRPRLVSTHLILGALGVELAALLLLRAEEPGAAPWALVLLAGAMFLGLVAGLVWKRYRHSAEALLVAHLFIGIAGFLVLLSWLRRSGGLG
jgi:hypothetical protein